MLGGLNHFVQLNRASCSLIVSNRQLRARWQQGFLKDLYHRRVVAGSEPLVHRSAFPNWTFAHSHLNTLFSKKECNGQRRPVFESKVDVDSVQFKANANNMKSVVDDLRKVVDGVVYGTEPVARDQHLKRGKLLARDRVEALIDPGTPFLELSQLAGYKLYSDEHVPAGGIITSIGTVSGRQCVIVANAATVKGGSYYFITVEKHLRAQETAQENNLPCIYLVFFWWSEPSSSRDYRSELFAFRHRIHGEDHDNEHFIQSLTNPTFFERKDVAVDAAGAQPALEKEIQNREDNAQLAVEGAFYVKNVLTGYLRTHYPNAPEEFIRALVQVLSSNEILAEAATSLGMQHLVRTGEFPPLPATLADAYRAVIAVLTPARQKIAIVENIIPKATTIPLEDVLPFAHPFDVLVDYAKKNLNAKFIEPRVMHSSGLDSVVSMWIVGIYADEKLIGSAPGETLPIAIDLASMAALLRFWGTTHDMLLIFSDIYEADYANTKPNHSLHDIVSKETDVSLLTQEELSVDPLNVATVAANYAGFEKEIGRPRISHLRHRFSRGSLFKRTFRYLVKPRPHSI